MDRTQRAIIQSYLAKARDKAHVARELFAKGHWDDAVSRAYYGNLTFRSYTPFLYMHEPWALDETRNL